MSEKESGIILSLPKKTPDEIKDFKRKWAELVELARARKRF